MYALYHKVHIYLEYHSVCPFVQIGTPPPPPPRPPGGGAATHEHHVHRRLQSGAQDSVVATLYPTHKQDEHERARTLDTPEHVWPAGHENSTSHA
jgi:hypothetical protein